MMYTVKVKFYAEYSDKKDKMETNFCFVSADDMYVVMHKMEEYFGKDCIEEITIADFSPDDFLVFESDISDMFYDVKSTLGAKVIW